MLNGLTGQNVAQRGLRPGSQPSGRELASQFLNSLSPAEQKEFIKTILQGLQTGENGAAGGVRPDTPQSGRELASQFFNSLSPVEQKNFLRIILQGSMSEEAIQKILQGLKTKQNATPQTIPTPENATP